MSQTIEFDAEHELQRLAALAAEDTRTPGLLGHLLRRSRRRRRRRALAGAVFVGVGAVSSVAAVTVGGGPYYSFTQPNASMVPTVALGSPVVVNRDLEAERGDVVQMTLHVPGSNVEVLRRVVGVGGDVVACPAGPSGTCAGVTVNHTTVAIDGLAGLQTRPFAPVTVPDGTVFVLGDARDNAIDSRSVDSPVEAADVHGVVVAVVGPEGKVQRLLGAPRHAIPDDYEVEPAQPVPSTTSRRVP